MHTKLTALIACLITATGPAHAEIYTLEMEGVITDFGANFTGADQFPFAGLSNGDQMLFHFEYDLSTMPSDTNGGLTYYTIDGAGSYVQLGASTIQFSQVSILVGTTNGAQFGALGFSGIAPELNGFNAGFSIEGGPGLPGDLPTEINLSDFNSARNAGANNELNDFLFPIVLGTVDSITITPAPAGSFALLAGGLLASIRRR